MAHIDVLTAGVAFFSFGIFLLVHGITFRWVRPERLLKLLLTAVIVTMVLPVILMVVFYNFKVVDMPLRAWVCAAIVASVVQGLWCFFYVLCIFGPYETSVRMRLVREIQKGGPTGITEQDLMERYNAEIMVELRLQRLLGSGDIIEKGGRYRLGHRRNFFFMFDAIARILKKWIGR